MSNCNMRMFGAQPTRFCGSERAACGWVLSLQLLQTDLPFAVFFVESNEKGSDIFPGIFAGC